MDADGFRTLIGGARCRCGSDRANVPAIAARTLNRLPADETADFAQLHDRFEHQATLHPDGPSLAIGQLDTLAVITLPAA